MRGLWAAPAWALGTLGTLGARPGEPDVRAYFGIPADAALPVPCLN